MFAPGEVHLWITALAGPSAADWELLDRGELERARRFVHARDGENFVARRAWLRRLLAAQAGVEPTRIEYHPYGNDKPVLSPRCNPGGLHFNYSHTGQLALCAITTAGPVGVDIERVRTLPDLTDMAARNFTANERTTVLSTDRGVVEAFFDCWARKEAFIKATGEGMSRDLLGFDVGMTRPEGGMVRERCGDGQPWYVCRLNPGRGVAAALCTRLPEPRLYWHRQVVGGIE
ncbi:MAG: 4'-phosphopantetheinyl transferase superfamily protein [Gammaproteobacteria bacterium]